VEHTDWDDLDAPVREAIQRRTGTVHGARTATAGLNSQLALILDAASGPVFVKGLPVGHPGVVRQHREAMINSHITPVAPRLLWQAEDAGWNLLAFDYIPGARHADYRPGSPDLPKVVIVDWAWPTRGAAFIDPACFLLRLMASGHAAASAERWAAQCAGWDQAPAPAVNAFAIASARLFAEIARDDHQPWKQQLASAASQWMTYRANSN